MCWATRTSCAGRTDAGVHALAQVVHADVDDSSDRARRWADLVRTSPETVRRRFDRMVGPAIIVWRVRVVPDDFDARFSATGRGYRYRMVDARVADPRLRTVRWTVGEPLRVGAMRAGAGPLLGEHDFTSLCRRAPGKHSVRRIDRLTVARVGEEVHVRLQAPAFCHQQVRSIVGCLVEVGAGRRDPEWVGRVLAARDRSVAARVAPPQGLTLERVAYGRRWPAAPPRPPA